ncbi:phage head morphogenesis protein [Anaerofustis stercorihominis]|uniref:Phage head morphogenesis protein n=1 Tax=Anaerofustis stercorihominis TaxID=214853 RepID=A0A3E3DZL8_9FIRM|nr:phage head morphogenesis protein [Anaerofustis stercorihominis]
MKGGNRVIPKHAVISESKKYKEWITIIGTYICAYCLGNNHKIIQKRSDVRWMPPVHPKCNCFIIKLKTILKGTATEKGDYGTDWWLKVMHKLPDNYIEYDEAMRKGWNPKVGNLHRTIPGKMIGGNIFQNKKKLLPIKSGRIWYEADFDYKWGYRNNKRLLYSNDGLVFATYDHYVSFYEII